MNTIEFTASDVSLQLEQGYHVLAFYNDDEYVFLQRLAEIGHKEDDGVYLEYNAPLHCGFDVIASVELSTSQCCIKLKSPLIKLPEVTTFTIALELSSEECQRYGELLTTIFADRMATITIAQ